MKKFSFLLILCLFATYLSAQEWKKMKDDPQVNIYDVIEAAEAYFETIDKEKKGSGWKGYQRWRHENEPKFYPSGDRSKADPFFAANAYRTYISENPSASRAPGVDRWIELGPYFIEEVTGHYSCGLGRVESFHIDPENPDRIYLGSRSGGFWKSLDGGETWTGGTTDFLIASGVNTMTASPTNSDSVLINLRNAQNGVTHGIYRSVDGGDTWQETPFNPTVLGWGGLGTIDRVSRIAYHPTRSGVVFLATSKGLFRSVDDLETWTTPVADSDFREIAFHPTDPDVIYAASVDNSSVVYVSTDGGETFTTSNPITDNSATIRLSTSAACPQCVYVGSSNGVWESTDEGQNFSRIGSPGIQNYGGFAVSDVSTNYILTGDLDVYMSQDGGQSFDIATFWSIGDATYDQSGQYVHADIRGARSIDGTFWINTDGFLCKSEDFGATWEFYEGQSIRENYNLGVSQSNHFRTICGSQDNGTSIHTEKNWIEFFGADGMEGIIHPLNDDWMIGSYQFGGRLRTKDGGYTLDYVTPPAEDGYWIAPLAYDPNDQMVVYDFREAVFRSEDFGSTWTELGSPSFSGAIMFAAVAENDSRNIVVTRNANIELSRNGGSSFTNIRANLPNGSITDVAFDPNDDDVIVVVYGTHQNDSRKVFITFDQGFSWNNITHNLNDMPVRSVVIDHTDDSNIYLGTEIGIYKKAMADDSWTLYSPGLPSVSVRELEVVYGSNTLRAATWGRGLWEFPLDGRAEYPSILTTQITDLPNEVKPQDGVSQTVTSVVSYQGELQDVYVTWSTGEPAFDGLIKMENVSDSTWVSTMPIPGQIEGTKVFFKVFAVGANSDTTETYKFMYEVKPFAHCVSFGNLQYATAVTLVDFDEINNPTGKTEPYTDYSEEFTATLQYGEGYDLNVNLNTDGDYVIRAVAWIDWNRDADFDDPGEEYDLGTAQNTVDGPTTLSPVDIRVPLDAVAATTRMRISCKYLDSPDRCETFFDGEVEDYAIVIQPVTLVQEIGAAICTSDSIFLGGDWQNTPGIYYDTITLSPIADSVVITTLEVFDTFEFNQQFFGCDSLTLPDGKTYYASLDTSIFKAGGEFQCDTLFNYSIEISTGQAAEIWEEACNAYTTPSGEMTYTESGTYVDVIPTSNGCDSIITINLEINTVDTAVTVDAPVLTAQAEDASYQWIDCETLQPIAGATNHEFTAARSGFYAVVVTQGECTDTSSCYQVVGVSVVENTFDREIQFYPNPTSGRVFIDLGGQYPSISARILSMDGRLIEAREYSQAEKLILDIDGPSGFYLIELLGEGEQGAVIQVLKN